MISLTRLLTLAFGLVLGVGLASLLHVSVSQVERSQQLRLANLVRDVIEAVEGALRAQLVPVEEQLAYLAREEANWQLPLDDQTALQHSLQAALAATAQVDGIGFYGVDGRVLTISRGQRRQNAGNWHQLPQVQHWIGEAPRDAVWGDPLWSAARRTALIPLLQPLWRGGEFRGLLVAVISINNLSYYLNQLRDQIGATPFVLSGREQVVAYPDLGTKLVRRLGGEHPLPRLDDIDDPALQRLWTPPTEPPGEVAGARTWLQARDDERVYYVTKYLDGYGAQPWLLGVYHRQQGTTDSERSLYGLIAAGLALLVLMVLVVRLVSTRIGRAVARLARAFEGVGNQPVQAIAQVPGSRVRELDALASAFNRMLEALVEKQRVERLFGRYLPAVVAEALVKEPDAGAPQQAEATVLFCDLEGFTGLSEQLEPAAIIEVLNAYFAVVTEVVEAHQGVITQFQGDAVLAVFNLPLPLPDHASRAVAAGQALIDATERQHFCGHRLRCRVGINTGSLVAGSVGASERLTYTVHGDAVNLAARLEAMNKALGTRILISDSTAQWLDGGELMAMGELPVRGREAPVRLYTLVTARED